MAQIINENLLELFRRLPCDICGRRPPSEVHHLIGRGMGGGSRIDHRMNLLSVCRRCHKMIHDGHVLGRVCWAVVGAREGTAAGLCEEFVRQIWRE